MTSSETIGIILMSVFGGSLLLCIIVAIAWMIITYFKEKRAENLHNDQFDNNYASPLNGYKAQ